MTSDGGSTVEAALSLTGVAELLTGLSGQLEQWQAELAQAQAQVRRLTELTEQSELSELSVRQRQEQEHPAELSCEEAVDLVLAALAGGARSVAHVRPSDSAFLDGLRARAAAWPPPGLSVQELISRPTRLQRVALGEDGCQARTVWIELDEVLIIDEAVALIPGPDAAQFTLVRPPSAVRQLALFFQAVWAQAAHPRESAPIPEGTEVELKQRIVRLLAEGAKDETVARRLGISLRTCRRHIAEILDQLGASSRFQAGVRAATIGAVPAYGRL